MEKTIDWVNSIIKELVEPSKKLRDILLKVQETNIKKYGCKWSLQNKEIRLKSKKSLYKNGTAQCSKQQLYIHNIIGGRLNTNLHGIIFL